MDLSKQAERRAFRGLKITTEEAQIIFYIKKIEKLSKEAKEILDPINLQIDSGKKPVNGLIILFKMYKKEVEEKKKGAKEILKILKRKNYLTTETSKKLFKKGREEIIEKLNKTIEEILTEADKLFLTMYGI